MANSQFSEKRWKYLSIGLMAILALGFSFPQASAHVTTNVQHMLEHIYNFVDGIEAKTNNLPADPASNTVVNTRASQASVDTLSSKLEMVRTLTVDNEQVQENQEIELLPIRLGQAYAIHGVLTASNLEEPFFPVTCQISGDESGGTFTTVFLANNAEETFDIACIRLSLGSSDIGSPAATVDGTILYTIQYRHI